MYEFCDTTELPRIKPLPSEAVCFDGKWLDNEIPGFRTLAVEGREFVSRKIDTYTVGITDGAYYRSASFDSRTITVQYQICAKNPNGFRESYNHLNSILRSTQAQLIFADEPDKYFVATRANHGNVQPGRNCVTGTIAFLCADPRKYSVKEKESDVAVESGEALISIRNDGNVPVPISYDITCDSDNGYVGIENGENYIRYGNEEEEDGEESTESVQMYDYNDFKAKANDSPTTTFNGTLSNTTVNGKEYVGALSNPGSGSSWHGAKRSMVLTSPAANFVYYSRHWFQCAFTREKGRIRVKFVDSAGNEIIILEIAKSNTSNSASTVKFWVNGELKNTFNFECSADTKKNPFLGDGGHIGIDKAGATIRLVYGGKYYTCYDDSLAETEVTKVQYCFYAYGTADALTRNYVANTYLWNTNVSSFSDVKNRYSAGDLLRIDGEEGKLYVNDIPKTGDELKGSEYFQAEPGQNAISVHCSAWATGIKVKARIREAWI